MSKVDPITSRWSQNDLYPIRDFSYKSAPSQVYSQHVRETFASSHRTNLRNQSELALNEIGLSRRHPPIETEGSRMTKLQLKTELDEDILADCKLFRMATPAHKLMSMRKPEPSYMSQLLLPDSNSTASKRDPKYERMASRQFSRDPDYFDWDLQHAVDSYRKPSASRLILAGPKISEEKLFRELSHTKGSKTLASHMFLDGEDTSDLSTNYTLAAMRTPTYWAYRFSRLSD